MQDGRGRRGLPTEALLQKLKHDVVETDDFRAEALNLGFELGGRSSDEVDLLDDERVVGNAKFRRVESDLLADGELMGEAAQ